jgi:uncharacterized cofD-like protein
LRGLAEACFPAQGSIPAPERERLTALVTVADDGGSSGALRRAYRMLAPGDIRNCLVALADAESTTRALFGFRFNAGVEHHSLGNLILVALSQLEQDFTKAVQRAGEILNIRGRVLPCTADNVTLVAEFSDGTWLSGESRITALRRPIRRVSLAPQNVRALPQALAAIAAADLIVIGPGSLYTSLLPTLLVPELAAAIAAARARVALVMNVMTEPGETDGYRAADVLCAIRRHVPSLTIHDVLLNTTALRPEWVARYAADGAAPLIDGADAIRALGCRPLERELLADGPLVRHDSHKLARAVLALAGEHMQERRAPRHAPIAHTGAPADAQTFNLS